MRSLLVILLATACLSGPLASPVRAHVPPPAYMTLEANEERLSFKAVLGSELFRDWFSTDPQGLASADKVELARLQGSVEAFFAEWCRVLVDDVPVRGVFAKAELVAFSDDGIPWEYVNVTVTYGLKGRPGRIALAWRKFENSIGWYLEPIDAEMYAFGDGSYFAFSENEPEYVWHAPDGGSDAGFVAIPVTLREVSLPGAVVVFLALAAGFSLWIIAGRLLHLSRLPFWLPATALAASAAFFGLNGLEKLNSWDEVAFSAPSEEEAGIIFETLQRNIYRAFDYEKEEDIYDTLALSVSGDLLGELYGEVYEGLILREEGGAVCRVESTEILERTVSLPEDRSVREFGVDCTWRVRGKVGHWGHTHRRVNEYKAKYLVAYQGDTWRIAGMETVDHRRVDEGR